MHAACTLPRSTPRSQTSFRVAPEYENENSLVGGTTRRSHMLVSARNRPKSKLTAETLLPSKLNAYIYKGASGTLLDTKFS